jgi:hypothetical protein
MGHISVTVESNFAIFEFLQSRVNFIECSSRNPHRYDLTSAKLSVSYVNHIGLSRI